MTNSFRNQWNINLSVIIYSILSSFPKKDFKRIQVSKHLEGLTLLWLVASPYANIWCKPRPHCALNLVGGGGRNVYTVQRDNKII